MGHKVVAHQVVSDDIDSIHQAVRRMLAEAAPQVIILTGGTGITPKDVTIEALQPHFTKELTGFGSLFSQLSYDQVGSAAIISQGHGGGCRRGHCVLSAGQYQGLPIGL